MGQSKKLLMAALITIMVYLTSQAVLGSNRPEPAKYLTVSGEIVRMDRNTSTVVIQDEELKEFTIVGFPFGYLERELEEENLTIEINIGDCVTVDYAIVICISENLIAKNIAIALTGICDNCEGDNCYEDEDGIVLRDENFYPVDKSMNGDEDDHNHFETRNNKDR